MVSAAAEDTWTLNRNNCQEVVKAIQKVNANSWPILLFLIPILLAELLLSFGYPFCSNYAKQILPRPTILYCRLIELVQKYIYTVFP